MPFTLSTTNTSSTPDQPGRWVVTKFGPPSVLKWETWDPTSDLSGGNVLPDRIIVAGLAGADNPTIGRLFRLSDIHPFTPGYDCVGEVIALGDAAPQESNVKVGDRVAALCVTRSHATHAILSYTELLPIEPSDDPVKVAALPLNYLTAYGMLKHSGVQLNSLPVRAS